jgi:hypothetical protein
MLSVILCDNPYGADEAEPIENIAARAAMFFPL